MGEKKDFSTNNYLIITNIFDYLYYEIVYTYRFIDLSLLLFSLSLLSIYLFFL
jgi:hypothetical protein